MNNIDNFTQSQGHGLFWDSEIREKVFNLPYCKNDTKKYDIDCCDNKFNINENISIKTSKDKGFACGDILRFYNSSFDKKYTIILIRYKQQGDFKKIVEIIEIDYDKELRDYLFGNIDEKSINEYVEYIKSIPTGVVDSNIKKKYKELKVKMQKDNNMIININPKVDSKNQRRVQCTIKDIDIIFKKFPEKLIHRSNDAKVRDCYITDSIISPKRKRNKKVK